MNWGYRGLVVSKLPLYRTWSAQCAGRRALRRPRPQRDALVADLPDHRPAQRRPDWLFLASFLVVQLATYLFFLRALAMPFVLKIVVAVMIVIGAAAAHFMAEYGTVIDSNMIWNVLQSDAAEARDLVTPAAVLRVFCFGVLPAALMLMISVQWPAWKTLLRRNAQMCLAALVVVGGNFAAFSGAYFSVLRENSEIALTSTPANVVIASGEPNGHTMVRTYSGPITPIGTDARIAPAGEGARPLVTILVIGETARAENFSLFGYGRDTNPALRKTPDLVAFPQVTSCSARTPAFPCLASSLVLDDRTIRSKPSSGARTCLISSSARGSTSCGSTIRAVARAGARARRP